MPVFDINGNDLIGANGRYNGKKVSFLGDSITTYVGYIPQGQSYEYNGSNNSVTSVNDTWWMKVINALGMTLEVNNSWSGTFVTRNNDSNKGSNSSGIVRGSLLGTNPDVIIVYMGINDFNAEVPLGTYIGDAAIPNEPLIFSSGYAMMLNNIMTAYQTAEIWCATLPQNERNGDTGAPEINGNGNSLRQFNNVIQSLALAFGAKVVDFAQSGLTYQNMARYMGDWQSGTGKGLHPNALGMSVLANQAIRQMDNKCDTYYSI